MSLRTILVVALALTCGVSAAVGVYQFRIPAEGATADTVPVVTAVADLGRWHVLDASAVKVGRYPKQSVPKGAFSSPEQVVDRCLLYPLAKGEPVLESKLTLKDAGRGLAALVSDGMRAFTIQTPHVAAGVGGFIRPGDKVDVLLTTSSTSAERDDLTGGAVTTTLLQNLQVLAVAQRLDVAEERKTDKADKADPDVKSVTLLVTPDQAAKLDLGMNKGVLHLALRNPKDDRDSGAQPATMAQLRLHHEKPFKFGEMWSQLTAATNRLAGAMSPTKSTPQTAWPASAEEQSWALIRTLRGSQAGGVRVEFGR